MENGARRGAGRLPPRNGCVWDLCELRAASCEHAPAAVRGTGTVPRCTVQGGGGTGPRSHPHIPAPPQSTTRSSGQRPSARGHRPARKPACAALRAACALRCVPNSNASACNSNPQPRLLLCCAWRTDSVPAAGCRTACCTHTLAAPAGSSVPRWHARAAGAQRTPDRLNGKVSARAPSPATGVRRCGAWAHGRARAGGSQALCSTPPRLRCTPLRRRRSPLRPVATARRSRRRWRRWHLRAADAACRPRAAPGVDGASAQAAPLRPPCASSSRLLVLGLMYGPSDGPDGGSVQAHGARGDQEVAGGRIRRCVSDTSRAVWHRPPRRARFTTRYGCGRYA